MTPSQLDMAIDGAQDWITDCEGVPPGELGNMTQQQVIRITHANYDGGWPAFIEADPSLSIEVVWLLMVRRFGIEFANRYNP